MKHWYLYRLKSMSFPEIIFRIKQLFKGHFEKKFGYKNKYNSEAFESQKNILKICTEDLKYKLFDFNIFGVNFNYNNPLEIDWHKDIFSGKKFPLKFYRKINIRSNPGLSAKNVWEINRLQFLTGVCVNYRATKDRTSLDLFIQINQSWTSQNPFLTGVNWYSNIEVNLRLITWFLCWEILNVENLVLEDDNFNRFVIKEWLPQIKNHCLYSYKNPSKYSSANNHLISEYAGLFIASSKWQFKESNKWIKYSKEGLEKEIIKQHSKNGINKEEAAEYIQFITDFFLLALVVGDNTMNPFSKQYKQQLQNILSYIYTFLDNNGNFPKYGDEDDGKCFILDYDEKFNNFRSLLTSGSIIFKDPMLKSRSNGYDLKNQFLFGESGKRVFESVPDIIQNNDSKFFSEEGHFIFRKNHEGKEIYLHFDAANLGYLSIAAHGHADALSFILNVDGYPVLIDSGTFTYHTEPEWRKYFIGTLAHNTIRINQKDQALNGGPTLWLNHFKTSLIDFIITDGQDSVKASHNGYSNENARHIREIVFNRSDNLFQITDTVIVHNNKKTEIEIPFHLHPEIAISNPDSRIFKFSNKHTRNIELYIDEKLDPLLIKGQIEPQILGWYSESFMKKESTNVIYCKTQIDSTSTFKFTIKIL